MNQAVLPEKKSLLKTQFENNGFTTKRFPQDLKKLMLHYIEAHIREIGSNYLPNEKVTLDSLENVALSIPDEIWSHKMSRAFRIFPKELAEKIYQWADSALTKEFDRKQSAVNVVYPAEAKTNPKISEKHLAIYWRCVRPGKPDAGRPHRDSSFWVLEFEEGYDPKIPFAFDYLKDCIKIWIPLKGCTPQTTLQIVPKSHKMEVPTVVEQTEYGRRPTISPDWLKANEKNFISPLELSQGSCIIFDMDLVHRGPTHNNNELRISAELCFILK